MLGFANDSRDACFWVNVFAARKRYRDVTQLASAVNDRKYCTHNKAMLSNCSYRSRRSMAARRRLMTVCLSILSFRLNCNRSFGKRFVPRAVDCMKGCGGCHAAFAPACILFHR